EREDTSMELQSTLVYGPVQSRRLGRSLGVNLGPAGRKTCNFNCAYCQYGWTNFPAKGSFPRPADVIDALDCALQRDPDVESITVAGNGEPTLHPGFAPIAEGIFKVRQRRAPGARLALLSNGPPMPLGRLIADLRGIGRLTLQSMFVRDSDRVVDNTTPKALDAWIDAVDRVRPQGVHVYTLDRVPARGSLVKVPEPVLHEIADRVAALGIPAQVFA